MPLIEVTMVQGRTPQQVSSLISALELAEDRVKYDIPDSVAGYRSGELDDPPGGWPEPFYSRVLAARGPGRPPPH